MKTKAGIPALIDSASTTGDLMPCSNVDDLDDLDDLYRQLVPRGALWWKPRGRRKWRLVGTFPTVADAIGALLEQQPRRQGNLMAMAEGKHPSDADEDDDA